MYLFLGKPPSPLERPLFDEFHAIGAEILSVLDLTSEVELVWRLDTASSTFELHLENGRTLGEEELLGVVALEPPIGDNKQIKEKEYFRAEKRAAWLAWIWSLKCPVVNRIPPTLWIPPHVPLPLWRPALRRCGLPAIDAMLSNLPLELDKFVSQPSDECNYVPLSIGQFYRVASSDDFEGLTKLAQFCPINLTQYSPLAYAACVVDRKVFWNQSMPTVLTKMQDPLIQLAAVTGLSFLEVGVLIVGDAPRVCSVNPFPKLDLFRPDTCDAIAKALLGVLRSD
jgi:hypothetical protein